MVEVGGWARVIRKPFLSHLTLKVGPSARTSTGGLDTWPSHIMGGVMLLTWPLRAPKCQSSSNGLALASHLGSASDTTERCFHCPPLVEADTVHPVSRGLVTDSHLSIWEYLEALF